MFKAITFVLMSILTVSAFAGSDASELNDVKCAYYQNKNDDPKMSVEFSYSGEEGEDFVHVVISKRMTDSDESWKVISETDEQLMVNKSVFSMGVDDRTIVINRPVPGWNKAKRPNGYLTLSPLGKEYKLYCENIKK